MSSSPHTSIILALHLLGPKYDSQPARNLIAAIGYQESNFQFRKQIKGPARGFWQFELGGGVKGVMTHHSTKEEAKRIARIREVDFIPENIYLALEYDDILAACFARLLLWTDPKPMPITQEDAWQYYLRNWRPGKPHPERWPDCYRRGLELMKPFDLPTQSIH